MSSEGRGKNRVRNLRLQVLCVSVEVRVEQKELICAQ